MTTMKKIIIWLGHPALGAMTFVGLELNPVIAALWVWLYLKYETNEDKWIKDRAYIDVKDFMIGFGAAMTIIFLWRYLEVKSHGQSSGL